MKMKVYTIQDGVVTEGAKVQPRLLSCGVTIPTVAVGEEGRGRKLGFLPVELSNSKDFETNGETVIYNCRLGKTAKGGHKLIEQQDSSDNDKCIDKCIVVLRTGIGFRGTNSHTGDRVVGSDPIEFMQFPCQVLAEGVIAQGTAGRMGSGQQFIAVAPRGVVFRTSYTGRLYGRASSHYYIFTGEKIMSATWEERIAADLF
jgi:hypothetical protein